jgi:hypothetical protein
MRNLLLIAVTGIVAAGCGSQERTGSDPVFPVSGVITYRGKPVAQADVTFFNAEKNRSAFGKTNPNGEYKLTTFSANDGAVEGQHVVTVVKLEQATETAPAAAIESEAYVPPGIGQSTEPKPPKSDLPEKYADQATSGLTATVKTDGPNVVNLDLE